MAKRGTVLLEQEKRGKVSPEIFPTDKFPKKKSFFGQSDFKKHIIFKVSKSVVIQEFKILSVATRVSSVYVHARFVNIY